MSDVGEQRRRFRRKYWGFMGRMYALVPLMALVIWLDLARHPVWGAVASLVLLAGMVWVLVWAWRNGLFNLREQRALARHLKAERRTKRGG